MTKITFIGAGSTVFAKNLVGDILSFPELAQSHICLFDIDAERLASSEIVCRRVAQALGAHPTIETTTDRRRALEGADYAICMIQVAGYKPGTVTDFDVPKRYGLRQTIADTLGIGGIMRGLRTIPVLLDMCRDMEELCPDVTFLQYVNPMAMNCWAINRATKIKTIGLCHSVQGTAKELANDIGIPIDEIDYLCAGINHMAFYLRFERGGEDLYPRIREVITDGRVPEDNRVRYEMFKRLGYFVTESSEHFSEYVPWFIKRDRPDLIEAYNIPLDEYIRRCKVQIADWDRQRAALEKGGKIKVRRSQEYGSLIIHSMETGRPRVVYGNVPNHGLISNLPQDCVVEVPCLVDKNGVQPTKIGALPPQLAAMMQTNINVQSLTVEAALTGKREHIYHAAMLDPHTAAELSLDQIWSLVDDLIDAHGSWLPPFPRSSTSRLPDVTVSKVKDKKGLAKKMRAAAGAKSTLRAVRSLHYKEAANGASEIGSVSEIDAGKNVEAPSVSDTSSINTDSEIASPSTGGSVAENRTGIVSLGKSNGVKANGTTKRNRPQRG